MSVNNLQRAEEEKKAVMSDFKSRIDGYQASTNNLASKISSGFEVRQIDCTIVADYGKETWTTIRDDTGEVVCTDKMSPEDLQAPMFDDHQGDQG